MEDDIEVCNTGLCLGLGIGGYVPKKKKQKENKQVGCFDLPFELCPKREETLKSVDHEEDGLFRVKRLDEGHQYANTFRKKLRLTKDQSALLEESFKLHTTLNPAQKQGLAEKLNLKPRQVEVWFQNRRARTKLKQTEVDCEFLRKCCENLKDENRRLKKELQELRALKVEPSPLYIQLSKAATLAMCSSCEKPFKANETKKKNNTNTINSNSKLQSVAIEF